VATAAVATVVWIVVDGSLIVFFYLCGEYYVVLYLKGGEKQIKNQTLTSHHSSMIINRFWFPVSLLLGLLLCMGHLLVSYTLLDSINPKSVVDLMCADLTVYSTTYVVCGDILLAVATA